MRKIHLLWLFILLSSIMTACSAPAATSTTTSASTTSTASSETTAALVTASSATSATTVSAAAQPGLIFEDNFDGTRLNTKNWLPCPEWERQGPLCIWDNDMYSLDGEGHLVLEAQWNEEEGRVHSGAVRSYGLFSAGYGYYDASIQFPQAAGTWGAFWMIAGDMGAAADGSAADGVEIDIVETIFNERGVYNHCLYWDGYSGDTQGASSGELKSINIYDGQFHTFGLLRSPEEYVFYVDGQESWRVPADQCEPCPEDGYLKLTYEAADWAGAGTDASISDLPAKMLVDYVRVCEEKPE